MKKTIIFLMMILVIFCLCACESNKDIKTTENDNIEIWTDVETGVQYVIYDRNTGYAGIGGITPRFNADGTLYGVPEENNEFCEHCGQALKGGVQE